MRALILAPAFLALPTVAGAINKCIDPAGKVAYQEAPCPPGSRSSAVSPPPAPSGEEALAAHARSARMIAEVARREAADSAALAAREAAFASARREQAERCQEARDAADLAGAFLISESDALRSWAVRRIAQARRVLDSNECRFRVY